MQSGSLLATTEDHRDRPFKLESKKCSVRSLGRFSLKPKVLAFTIHSITLLALKKEVLYDQHYKSFTIESIKEKEEKAF